MSKRRQKRAQLRALECLAYASTLSYLRSQNDYDKEAKYILEHLRPLLHISSHRHLAELKRIVNDEELERLGSLKHLGESNLKNKWIELEEKEEEDNKSSNNSTSIRKKFKGS
jgi:inactivated superfamily I helicase